ncbi:MAG TPA: sn-glycerol-3-phosphate ABC transporter ATP-binding protein UgpC [Actinomycetota bacterium]|nr:sn-glycerol-3-phosphate ABC transporter ATP-binding protein UgpC [Actinomycetota bacterium]
MAGLTFEHVWKSYGDVQALRGVDLEVGEGEFFALVGPSASGKSTVLRVAAGLEEVSRGNIRIGGRDVTALSPVDRNVAMVFQNYALFPHLNVAENVGFGLTARKVAKAEVERRVRSTAQLVGCEDLLGRKPHELSGGERQRVALARALARDPDVFLLDEPLSNLDAQLRVQMRVELKRLHQRVGTTTVFVTHDQVEALTLGERVGVLHRGAIEQVGTPDEIYRHPANRFVAGFIGTPAMNFMKAKVEEGRMRAGPFSVPVPRDASRFSARSLDAGIRPEHLRVSHDNDGVPARVEVVEVAGNETFVHVRAHEHGLVARGGPNLRPSVGETVYLKPTPGSVHVFDAESGRTLAHSA